MLSSRRSVWIGLTLSIVSGVALGAGEPAVAPLKGQSPEQIERDKAECLGVALEAMVLAAAAQPQQAGAPAPPPSAGQQAGTPGGKRPGLFGGLRRIDEGGAPLVEPPAGEESGSQDNQAVLDQAYAECLAARGYSVN